MELEGLKRGLQTLEDCAIAIKSLTTDRHIQVRKYLREEKPHIKQWFDYWHIAKSKCCIVNMPTLLYLFCIH